MKLKLLLDNFLMATEKKQVLIMLNSYTFQLKHFMIVLKICQESWQKEEMKIMIKLSLKPFKIKI